MNWLGSLVKLVGKASTVAGGIRGASKFAGRSHLGAKAALNNLKWQLPVMGLGLLGPGTPHEKMENVMWNVAGFYLTLGMGSPWRQAAWGFAIGAVPLYGQMMRGLAHGYRGALESRSSVSIPFSHSTIAMDQAYATLQYSRQRMSDAYQTVGSEATFMAARYMSRG